MDGAANLRHFDEVLQGMTGRDVILLPEMFTTGFAMEAAASSLPQDQVVAWLHGHAKALNARSAAARRFRATGRGKPFPAGGARRHAAPVRQTPSVPHGQ